MIVRAVRDEDVIYFYIMFYLFFLFSSNCFRLYLLEKIILESTDYKYYVVPKKNIKSVLVTKTHKQKRKRSFC